MNHLQTLDMDLVNNLIGGKVIEIRAIKKGKTLHNIQMDTIVKGNEIENECNEWWTYWNYQHPWDWLGGYDSLEDEEYDPIYLPLYPDYILSNR